MACPRTRDFQAVINLMPGPVSGNPLIVTGEVETSATNIRPKLVEANPQGYNPQILILDLALEKIADVGAQVVLYHPARFERPAEAGQYEQVGIRFEGKTCLTLDVTEAQ